MAEVTGASASGTTYAAGTAERSSANQLDKNAFLNLLLTQLQFQDPMKPMADQEFISQLAQFSALEQTQTMAQNLDRLASVMQGNGLVSYIGRTVTAQGPDDDAATRGQVTAVSFMDGAPVFTVNGKAIDPSWVTKVE